MCSTQTIMTEVQIFHSLTARDLTMFFNIDRAPIWSSVVGATILRNSLGQMDTDMTYHCIHQAKVPNRMLKKGKWVQILRQNLSKQFRIWAFWGEIHPIWEWMAAFWLIFEASKHFFSILLDSYSNKPATKNKYWLASGRLTHLTYLVLEQYQWMTNS